ncbi:MAG: methyltransferase domain-containing protein [Candidatus Acidiferrales bacterium]
MAVWNPDVYLKYAAERLRPAMDLLSRVPLSRCERAYDLGCGAGNVTHLLHERWPQAKITGVDNSSEMLSRARAEHPALDWVHADITSWRAADSPDLIFSNAALHWLPGHAELFPALLRQLRPGGFLAVQMPHHTGDPGHVLILETARDPRWSARLVPLASQLNTHSPEEYWRWLRPLSAQFDVWETIYIHELEGERPVVEFFRGTQLRTYLQALDASEQAAFLDSYAEKVARAYPHQLNGKTLFPFRRIFLLARR